MARNAGFKHSNKPRSALVPGFGKVYFNKNATAKVIEFSDLKKRYWITYDSDKEDAFIVHKRRTRSSSSNVALKAGYSNMRYPRTTRKTCNPQNAKVAQASNLISTVTNG